MLYKPFLQLHTDTVDVTYHPHPERSIRRWFQGRVSIGLNFDSRGIWLGFRWKLTVEGHGQVPEAHLDIYICLVPMVVLHLSVARDK